ncbi:transcription factor BOA-like [Vicia villosa]|uniref:transcription factor BOA-like n=1 Tax=Vicia villosa TaxID=3911 RepID=UPI00273C0C97|nr:transcription factor BOA-like [Vicia villosa]XP_058744069.1 transcription factor BOA-like [Vicia villosa]XP_058744070.1 transcription factor BOA-like [Vicia villosa]
MFSAEESSFGRRQSKMITVNKGLESQSSINTKVQSLQYANGKIQESPDADTTLLPRKRRRTWTDDLHRKFLEAVETAGINARPKVIFELMDVEGLTKESVANYLQKYRQSMKLRASAMAQHVNGYVSLTKKRGKGPLFFKNQDATKNPSNLSDGMPVQASDSSALYASLGSSNYQESPFEQSQMYPPLKQQRVEKQLDFRTLLAFDMNDQFYPALPIALLPPEKDKKIDEIFYSKQMFTDEDLNMWLSTIPDNVDDDGNDNTFA